MATDQADTGTAQDTTSHAEAEALNIQDVLTGIAQEGAGAGTAGAYLTFETVGNNTVISVDPDGAGPGAPIQVVTLTNITGVTLQDLLNNIPVSN